MLQSIAIGAALLLSSSTPGEPKLAIGDPAPALRIQSWLRGPSIERLEPGSIYVIDFWSVWCAPCIAQLPHMTRLQERFASAGVKIIGLTGPDTEGNTLEAVQAVLERQGDAVAFSIAYDARDADSPPYLETFEGVTTKAYLGDADLEGLPTSFVIDRDGAIAWVGLPTELEAVLEAVVAGTWDREAAAKQQRTVRLAVGALMELKQLMDRGEFERAHAIASRLIDGPFVDSSGFLRVIASRLSTPKDEAGWNLDLALRAAQRADEVTAHSDVVILAVLARVHRERGDLDEAITAQRRAVDLASGDLRSALAKTLEEYQRLARK